MPDGPAADTGVCSCINTRAVLARPTVWPVHLQVCCLGPSSPPAEGQSFGWPIGQPTHLNSHGIQLYLVACTHAACGLAIGNAALQAATLSSGQVRCIGVAMVSNGPPYLSGSLRKACWQ